MPPGILTITQTTYLKPTPTDSGLSREGFRAIPKGMTLKVTDAVEVSGHFKVSLVEAIAEEKEWFVFQGHCKFIPTTAKQDVSKLKLDDTLASRIVMRMDVLGHKIFTGPGELTLVYLEGVNADGMPNGDALDGWNDRRIVIRFEDGKPIIVCNYQATTEPGAFYVRNPMNPKGAARIKIDSQFTAWQVGIHGNSEPHESLVQVLPITVCRDFNRDGFRTGDKLDTGLFGINCHWGFDMANVGKASAGCLVGRSRKEHKEYMRIIKTDPRYIENRRFIFTVAVLDGAKL